MKTWITADLHLGHANLIKGTSKWRDTSKCRNFNTIEEHDNHVLSQLNKYVEKDDILIIVGDVMFGDKNKLVPFVQNLLCTDIHLIYGNHDEFIREDRNLKWEKHHASAQSCFKSIKERDSFYVYNQKVIIDHYPIEKGCWDDCTKGSVMIHGHVHGNLHDRQVRGRIDVGWDSSLLYFNEYRPFTLDEAIELSII